ncbi:uncharacterized protein PGRI_041110 [Penicillium griseofulvum]|uniref:Uncharacterized protein n=1 Tax=Penicillium patulum TaxID=5078 RepID=A0A135L8B3_PENPA|nr:uncharacterized protein PGRI_041110 [Penicillium griseofulvum]KXG45198.1 hypothetical protein PGRI_041110 [Penicillium griseofulvum]
MACSPSDEAKFIKKQELLRDHCSAALASHMKTNPDVVWTKENSDNAMMRPEEAAQFKLVLDVQFDEETGQPIFPPPYTRLSDELVYLMTKFMASQERGRRYPYDFDSIGNIRPERVSSGPAPIIWAHGIPFFPVYKGYYILCGRENVKCIGWLLHEKTREIMAANPIWSVGAVIAPDSAVNLPHTITRQLTQHKPHGAEKDANYKGKAWARDVVADEHHLCAVVPNPDTNEIEVCPLYKAWGYNVRCGPTEGGVNPTIMPKEFFVSHGVEDIDYASLDRPYANEMMDEDEESDDETANVVEDDMEDIPKETAKDITIEVTENVTGNRTQDAMKQVTEQVANELEIVASDLEEKQSILPGSIVNTELDLNMDVVDPTKDSMGKPDPEQTSTSTIPFPETAIQVLTNLQTTEMELLAMQPEIEQAATSSSAENTQTVDPPNMERIIPITERLEHSTACASSDKPNNGEAPASQSITGRTVVGKETDNDNSQPPAEVPV